LRLGINFAIALALVGGLSACGSEPPAEPPNAAQVTAERQERFREMLAHGGNLARRERVQERRAERFKESYEARPLARKGRNCYPSYYPCVPPPPPALNCDDLDGQVSVRDDDDPHGFDRDLDGTGCEAAIGQASPYRGSGGSPSGGGGETGSAGGGSVEAPDFDVPGVPGE
jgi:hypothetical protein